MREKTSAITNLLVLVGLLSAMIVVSTPAFGAACSPLKITRTVEGHVDAIVGNDYVKTFYKISRIRQYLSTCSSYEYVTTEDANPTLNRVDWNIASGNGQAAWMFYSNYWTPFISGSYVVAISDAETYAKTGGDSSSSSAFLYCYDEGSPPGQVKYKWKTANLPPGLSGQPLPLIIRAAIQYVKTVNQTVSLPAP